jgi:hypothetical protein
MGAFADGFLWILGAFSALVAIGTVALAVSIATGIYAERKGK